MHVISNFNESVSKVIGSTLYLKGHCFYVSADNTILPAMERDGDQYLFKLHKKADVKRPVLVQNVNEIRQDGHHYYALNLEQANCVTHKTSRAFYRAVTETGQASPDKLLAIYKRLGVDAACHVSETGETHLFIPELDNENIALTYLGSWT